MSNSEQYRAGFEAWARAERYRIEREGDGYYWPITDDAWKIWIAAKRESGSGSSTSTSQGAEPRFYACAYESMIMDDSFGGESMTGTWYCVNIIDRRRVRRFKNGHMIEESYPAYYYKTMYEAEIRAEGLNRFFSAVQNVDGAAPGDALDAARYKAEQHSMILGQAVAYHRCEWPEPPWADVMFFNGHRITKAEFNERSAIATSTAQKGESDAT